MSQGPMGLAGALSEPVPVVWAVIDAAHVSASTIADILTNSILVFMIILTASANFWPHPAFDARALETAGTLTEPRTEE
jgi:hypothetical protein